MSEKPGFDLDGYPDVVKVKADHYQKIANSITRAVNTLNSIADTDSMKGDGIDKIRDKAGDLADDIAKAQLRYAQTASALLTYSSKLRQAQTDAATANSGLRSVLGSDFDFNDTFTLNTEMTSGDHADEVKRYVGNWNSAKSDRDRAADAAKNDIEDVVTGPHNNGLEDPKKHWWQKALDIVKKVCDVAGVLSIFLGWVPILGEVLIGLAALGAVIDLVTGIVDVAKNGWSLKGALEIASGVLGLIPGGGRLAKAGLKAFKHAPAEMSTLARLGKSGLAMSKASRRMLNGMFKESRALRGELSGLSRSQQIAKITASLKDKGLENLEGMGWKTMSSLADRYGLKSLVDVAKYARESGKSVAEYLKSTSPQALAEAARHGEHITTAGEAAVKHLVGQGKAAVNAAKDLNDTVDSQQKSEAQDQRTDAEEKQALKDAHTPEQKQEIKNEFNQYRKDLNGNFGDDVKAGLKDTDPGKAAVAVGLAKGD